jgi:flagellar basal-body rod modification protein FlgD
MTIGAVTSSSSTSSSQTLNMQDFLKVLLTQLTYQDPLKPLDNQEFMAQMAQFTSLQQTQELNDKMTQLITNQAALQSIGLIGRTVDITTATGTTDSGTVTALSLSGSTPSMTIHSTSGATLTDISLSQVTAVR